MIPIHTDFQTPYTSNGEERGIEGEVRAIRGQLKVFDGTGWQQLSTVSWIDDFDLKTVVEWAKQKMEQELIELRLAEQFPAVARAKENYELIKRLTINEMA